MAKFRKNLVTKHYRQNIATANGHLEQEQQHLHPMRTVPLLQENLEELKPV